MTKEIEKKILLSSLPSRLEKGIEIKQGYLSTGDPEVRVRQKGKKFFATRKEGEGFIRSELESEISSEVFEILWPATKEARIEKIRYELVSSDGLVWEIDYFHGHLQGLLIAEIELPDHDTKATMPKEIQAVFVRDVTADSRYKNKNLATKGIPD